MSTSDRGKSRSRLHVWKMVGGDLQQCGRIGQPMELIFHPESTKQRSRKVLPNAKRL